MQQEITITFTEQEFMALQQLLHRALQHSGMEVFDAVAVVRNRLQQAVAAHQEAQRGNGSFAQAPTFAEAN